LDDDDDTSSSSAAEATFEAVIAFSAALPFFFLASPAVFELELRAPSATPSGVASRSLRSLKNEP